MEPAIRRFDIPPNQEIMATMSSPNSKHEQDAKTLLTWRPLAQNLIRRFKVHDLTTCKSRVQLLFAQRVNNDKCDMFSSNQ